MLFISSCSSIRLVSEYDEITDKAATALQQNISTFFIKVQDEAGTEAAKYENYKLFYQQTKVELNTLQIRADAVEKNQIVQDEVTILNQMVLDLEKLHKKGFGRPEELDLLKKGFNSAFTAITKFQLALKRGEKK